MCDIIGIPALFKFPNHKVRKVGVPGVLHNQFYELCCVLLFEIVGDLLAIVAIVGAATIKDRLDAMGTSPQIPHIQTLDTSPIEGADFPVRIKIGGGEAPVELEFNRVELKAPFAVDRSEERRVGKEGQATGSRYSHRIRNEPYGQVR